MRQFCFQTGLDDGIEVTKYFNDLTEAKRFVSENCDLSEQDFADLFTDDGGDYYHSRTSITGVDWISIVQVEMIDGRKLDRAMTVAEDVKTVFGYNKTSGDFFWHDRDEPENTHEFATFWQTVQDAVAPYTPEAEKD